MRRHVKITKVSPSTRTQRKSEQKLAVKDAIVIVTFRHRNPAKLVGKHEEDYLELRGGLSPLVFIHCYAFS